jgi:hypothetical protein
VRAFYFSAILNIWRWSNFSAGEVEILPQHDSFPEGYAHLVEVATQVEELGSDVGINLAADLFATVGFPFKVLHGSAVGVFIDDELARRADDWQRQVSDQIMDIGEIDMTRLARAIVG